MAKQYRLTCKVCNEFIGIDIIYSVGRSGNTVLLPPEADVIHIAMNQHTVYFPKTGSGWPQGE